MGCDVFDVDRMRARLVGADDVLDAVFTPRERADGDRRPDPAAYLARCFAAKEAALKALAAAGGQGSFWQDIEVTDADRSARLRLSGRLAGLAAEYGATGLLASTALTGGLATAEVICEGERGGRTPSGAEG